MKTTALLAYLYFFLLLAFTTTAEKVYDSDGDLLRNGGAYYLSPLYYGGVISPLALWNGTTACSLAVVQGFYQSKWAMTIASPVKASFISTTFPLNISITHFPPNVCTKSSSWVVIRSLGVGKPVMVGKAQDFGDAFVEGSFYIKSTGVRSFYTLLFCYKDECGNIGLHLDNENNRRLAVIDGLPSIFKFDKVNDHFASDLSMVV